MREVRLYPRSDNTGVQELTSPAHVGDASQAVGRCNGDGLMTIIQRRHAITPVQRRLCGWERLSLKTTACKCSAGERYAGSSLGVGWMRRRPSI